MAQKVSITSPANGSTVKGTVTIQTTTNSVRKLYFYIDGVLVGTDVTTPYSYVWDTTKYKNGPHTIKAISGNKSASSSISVNISNNILKASFSYKEL